MHVRSVIATLFLLLTFLGRSQNDLVSVKNFGSNPGNLTLYLHVPQNKKAHSPLPLVVALHGCNQNVASLSKISGWNALGDKYNFYVIYPQQKIINNASFCFNWFNEKDISKDRGEALSIKQMIDFMRDTFLIDTTKIFVYGLSAGAAMSISLLADYPYLFNAGAILAGGPFMMAKDPLSGVSAMMNPKNKTQKELTEPVLAQNPGYAKNYPRVIIAHGKSDKVVNPKNSYELIKQWSYILQTDTVPTKKINDFAGNKDVEKKIYCDKNNAEKIIFYDIKHLGHVLAVDPGDGPEQGGHIGLFAVDKDFYSTYWIAKDFGLIP